MKTFFHQSQRFLHLVSFFLMMLCIGNCYAQEVTLDFTQDYWNIGNIALGSEQCKTYNGITIKFGQGCKFAEDIYSDKTISYFVLDGKKSAYITLPAFDFDVEKIVVDGEESGNSSVKQNIYVGNTPVSKVTTSAKVSHTYLIDEKYQSKGTLYSLKVTNNYISRVTAIKIYKKTSSDKMVTMLSFDEPTYKADLGDQQQILPLLKAGDQEVAGKSFDWTSTNKDVAVVDAEGNVTAIATGKSIITASFAGDDIYVGSSASYELYVTASSNGVVTSTIDLSKEGFKDGEIIKNISLGDLFFSFDDDGGTTPKWYDNGNSVRLYERNQLTISSNYRIKSIEFVFDSGKTDNTKDTPNSSNTTFSIGKFDYSSNILELSALDTKEVTLTINKIDGNKNHISIQKVIVNTYASGTIVIGTNEGYGTYYSDVNYVLPEGLVAYGYTNINADGVLTKSDKYVAGDVIPANTAVMVEGNKGTYNFNATDMAATKTVEGNLLKGVTETTTIEKSDDVSRYVLTYVDGVLGFYKTNSGNIKVQSNRAYLEIPNVNAVPCIFLGGESTGVELNKIALVSSGIYTISGVLLKERDTKNLPAGLYIQNGKVIIIK